ncbi:hypothetical protein GBA52_007090 [Prunus armeniaca]|nr:hypothetical protein GBA52_007090 [Prunus armeniaca]
MAPITTLVSFLLTHFGFLLSPWTPAFHSFRVPPGYVQVQVQVRRRLVFWFWSCDGMMCGFQV